MIEPKIYFTEYQSTQEVNPAFRGKGRKVKNARRNNIRLVISTDSLKGIGICDSIDIREVNGELIIKKPDIDSVNIRKVKNSVCAYSPRYEIDFNKEYFGEIIDESIIFKIE